MSRFRFRVWDTKDKEYLDPNYYEVFCLLPDGNPHVGMTIYNGICDEYQVIPPKQLIVEQCTGLKDKNGTLIYEGDIVKTLGGNIGIVKFENAMFSVFQENTYYTSVLGVDEIIGNVHDMEVKDE